MVPSAITNKNGLCRFTTGLNRIYIVEHLDGELSKLYETVAPFTSHVFSQGYGNDNIIEIYNKEKGGSIIIKKRTADMTNISGIKFILSGTTETGRDITMEAITDSTGTATFLEVPLGTYIVTEDSATVPTAYLVANAQEVTVEYNQSSYLNFTNVEKKGSIEIRKTTEDMNDIANIKFILSGTADTGKVVSMEATTNASGKAYFNNILVGTYTITEDSSTVPLAYMVADEQDVTVSYAQTTIVEIKNEQKSGSIEITKTTPGMLNVGGINFILSGTSNSGKDIEIEALTNSSGIANFDKIPVGTYTITEDGKTVPTAYLVADPQQVTVNYATTTNVAIANEEKTGTIQITKSTPGMTNISGINFILSGTSDTGRKINIEALTNSSGIATFEKIPIGTYTVTEDGKTVPTAYLVADDKQVTVSYATTTNVAISNEEKTGTIQITKSTPGMTNISGINFILSGKSDSGRDISIGALTNSSGIATFEKIPIGTYTITEDGKTVPVAYLVADAKQVTVSYAATTNIAISNKERTGSIEIKKTTPGMLNVANIKFILSGKSDTGRDIRINGSVESTRNICIPCRW